jgi:hypothetical protein
LNFLQIHEINEKKANSNNNTKLWLKLQVLL